MFCGKKGPDAREAGIGGGVSWEGACCSFRWQRCLFRGVGLWEGRQEAAGKEREGRHASMKARQEGCPSQPTEACPH